MLMISTSLLRPKMRRIGVMKKSFAWMAADGTNAVEMDGLRIVARRTMGDDVAVICCCCCDGGGGVVGLLLLSPPPDDVRR